MFQGSEDAPILIISDFLRIDEKAEQSVIAGPRRLILRQALKEAGIRDSEHSLLCLNTTEGSLDENLKKLKESRAKVLVALGAYPLKILTQHDNINKYHCSILKSRSEYGSRTVIPVYHPADAVRDYSLRPFISLGLRKALRELSEEKFHQAQNRIFHLGPTLEDTIRFLKEKASKAEVLSLDVETGRGQINTLGIAVSPTEAIAIETLPDRLSDENYYLLWSTIRDVLESDIPKVMQNFLYDTQYLSKYGILVKNIHHDTMWAMKFLNPEFKAGLDNVGRVYTPFPYWKDDGKGWNNIRDWKKHFEYNCQDTTGTLWAYYEQKQELESRGLSDLFYGYVMKFAEPIREMVTSGLLLDPKRHHDLKTRVEGEASHLLTKIQEISEQRCGKKLNPRSPKQLKEVLEELGIKVPTVKGKVSTDKKALIKLKKKYPKEDILGMLVHLSAKNKLLSSYINFQYDSDGRVRYALNGCATETGRWNSTLDPWGNGFNAQTVPKSVRSIFRSSPGNQLIQIDLAQAESRYVAWEAPEPTLMKLIQEGRDIHKYVAARIFNKLEDLVTKQERQLGKKSGHAANYGVGPRTFAEACQVEMNLAVTEPEARRIIDAYYQVFPGIRNRQTQIQQKVSRYRKLTTPLGRERHFHDRIGDSMFREAYAYAPQSTIPDIINHLILHLFNFRSVRLLLQVHDSVLLECSESDVGAVIQSASDLESWHPRIDLPGGRLLIPIDVETGTYWGQMESV